MIKTTYFCDRCGKELPHTTGEACLKFNFLMDNPTSWISPQLNERGILCEDCFETVMEKVSAALLPENDNE